jgi:hypothetical protein
MTSTPSTYSTKRCLFCASVVAGQKSREHVIPTWLRRLLFAESKSIVLNAYDADFVTVAQRPQTLNELVVTRICKRCNNGWMNELEGAMQGVLPPLIHGDKEITALSPDEAMSVGRWACKTAYMLDAANLSFPRVPPEHLRKLWLYQDRLPPEVAAIATRSPFFTAVDWIDSPNWAAPRVSNGHEVDAVLVRNTKRSYKVAMQFGHLILAIAYWPSGRDRLALIEGFHIPLVLPEPAHPMSVDGKGPLEEDDHRQVLNNTVWGIMAVPRDLPWNVKNIGELNLVKMENGPSLRPHAQKMRVRSGHAMNMSTKR